MLISCVFCVIMQIQKVTRVPQTYNVTETTNFNFVIKCSTVHSVVASDQTHNYEKRTVI